MSTTTWATVSPLVHKVVPEGRNLTVVFRCPDTGEKVSSRAAMTSSGDGVMPVLGRQAASYAQHTMRQELARTVRGALGGGLLGSLGYGAAWQATQGAATATRRETLFSDEDQQQAIVRAFLDVRQHFRWDGDHWTWAAQASPWPARDALTGPTSTPERRPAPPSLPPPPAALPPRGAPPATAPAAPPATTSRPDPAPADADAIVLRAVVEVAFADARLGPEEVGLAETLGLSEADVKALKGQPVQPADAAGLDAEARERVYLMAAAMAYADTELSGAENATLERLATALDLRRAQRSELDRGAREHLLTLMIRDAWRDGAPDGAAELALRNQALRWGVPPIRLQQLIQKARG